MLDPKTVQAKVQSPKMTKKHFPFFKRVSQGINILDFFSIVSTENDDANGNKENHQLGDSVPTNIPVNHHLKLTLYWK